MSFFSKRLKEEREALGLTLHTIAKMLDISHVSYFHWEQGKNQPSIEKLIKLCEIFNVSIDYLVGLEDDFGAKSYTPPIKVHHNPTPLTPQKKELLEDISNLNESEVSYVRGMVHAYKNQINKQTKKQG